MRRNFEPHTSTVVLFGKTFSEGFRLHFRTMMTRLSFYGTEIYMFKPFYDFVSTWYEDSLENVNLFKSTEDLPSTADVMLSIGGDGTFLEAVTYVRDRGIPVAGINIGRLGFLADIAQEVLCHVFIDLQIKIELIEILEGLAGLVEFVTRTRNHHGGTQIGK